MCAAGLCVLLQAARPAREVSVLQQRVSAAEAEAQGLREALEAAQERHTQHLAKYVWARAGWLVDCLAWH